jgi:transcriptional regulator with XRE-family HTH domain
MENTKKILKLINMKAFRVSNDLSQKEVAEYLDVSIAFISAVERGQAKLPAEKLARLLENDREWETSSLIDSPDRASRVHNDYRTMSGIGQNFEGDFNAPVHNYNGYSEKEFEKELRSRLEKKDLQIAALEAENLSLRQQLAVALSDKQWLQDLIARSGLKALPDEQ